MPGLATCWIGIFDEPDMKEVLGIPEEVRLVNLVVVGYPADVPEPRPRLAMVAALSRARSAQNMVPITSGNRGYLELEFAGN